MMKKIHIILFLLVASFGIAQQLPQYSQYMLNEMAINPAVAGRDEYPEVRSNNRYQWAGINDAPRTYMLTLQGPIQDKHMGLGMNLYTDIVGPTRRTGLNGSYAYHLQLNDKKMFLSMALSAGILQWGIDGSKITLHDEGDQQLLTTYQTTIVPDLGAGLYFYQKNKFYVGLSMPQMYQAPISLYSEAAKNSKIVSQINLNAAYTFSVGSDFKIEPSFLLMYVKPAPAKINIGVRAIYKDQIWMGTSLRTHDAVSFIIGYMYKNYLMIGYSYDVTTTNIKKTTNGSNEIMLGIRFSHKQSATWETQPKEKTTEITSTEQDSATTQKPKKLKRRKQEQKTEEANSVEETPKIEELASPTQSQSPKEEQKSTGEKPAKEEQK